MPHSGELRTNLPSPVEPSGELSVNLTTTDEATKPIPVGAFNKFTCQIVPTGTWSSAVVALQWTNCPDYETWDAFSPAVTATSSAKYMVNVSVTNRRFIRLKPSTAEPASDAAAVVLWQLR